MDDPIMMLLGLKVTTHVVEGDTFTEVYMYINLFTIFSSSTYSIIILVHCAAGLVRCRALCGGPELSEVICSSSDYEVLCI